jgi:hypothetical protein
VIIIWGFRARAKTLSEGEFFCPKCGVDRRYLLQEIRRWFTFFFIPLFPTGKIFGTQVKCRTCGTCFRPEVLSAPTSASLTDAIRNAMRVAAIAMIRAGAAGERGAGRSFAVNVLRTSGWEAYDDAALSSDLAHCDVSQLAAYLTPLAQGLTTQGKEAFVAKLAHIALADGPPNEHETAVLDTVGASLQLTAAHLLGIVSSVQAAPSTTLGDQPAP